MSVAPAALADTYTTIDFPGAIATDASGINSSGEIVGAYTDSTGAQHGFRLNDGAFTAIDVPGASRTVPISINSHGDVAGFFLDPSNQWHGFVLSNGHFSVQDYPGATTGTFTLGISANGTLVGEFKTGQAFGQLGFAWILRHGQYSQLIPPGAVQAFATSVNSRGDVVGRLIDGAGQQTAWKMDRKGTYTVFQFPGASLTNARNINSKGQVVGVYRLGGVNHGFILPKNDFANFTTIDFPGAASTRALGINSRGDIVGTYDLAGVAGLGHSFLLSRDDDDDHDHGDDDNGHE
jgi:probable HAF family extracellular repeat protein